MNLLKKEKKKILKKQMYQNVVILHLQNMPTDSENIFSLI